MTRVLIAVAAALAIASAGGTAPRADVTDVTVAAFERWVEAVDRHTPGVTDASVSAIWQTSVGQRLELDNGLALFLSILIGKDARVASIPERRLADLASRHRGTHFN